MRRAFTLVDLALTLAVSALAAAIALPRTVAVADALRVRAATDDAVNAIATARHAAIHRSEVTTLVADTSRATVLVRAGAVTLVQRDVGGAWGVRLLATRDSIRFAPTGLGYGAANTTLVLTRGRAAVPAAGWRPA